MGAGAIIKELQGRLSPEATAAIAAFNSLSDLLRENMLECSSGRELAERGFSADVELAAELNVSEIVPVLHQEAFVRFCGGAARQ